MLITISGSGADACATTAQSKEINFARFEMGDVLFALRWLVPALLALLGLVYIWHIQRQSGSYALLSLYGSLLAVLWVLIVPTLAWAALTWVAAAFQERTFRKREATVLDTIRDVANQSLETDKVLQKALETMVDHLGLEAGDIRLLEGDTLVLGRHYGVSSAFVNCEQCIRVGHCLCGRSALTGKSIAVSVLAEEPSLVDSPCAKEGFQSMASLPMQIAGHVTGVLHVASRRPNAFSPRKLAAFTVIGDRIASVIKNARVYETARRQAAYMEAASLIGQRITSLINHDSLLEEIAGLIRRKFGYLYCHILLVDKTTEELILKATSGPDLRSLESRSERLKIGQHSVAGWVACTGQTLIVNQRPQSSHNQGWELQGDVRAELAAPMRVGNRIIGVLDVQSDRQGVFSKEDMDALQILGNQLGTAIENARLFQETERRYMAMVALHATTLDVISQLDMNELLNALLDRGVKLVGAPAGAFFRYDAAKDHFYNVATYNLSQEWNGLTLAPDESIIAQIILDNSPLLLNDYQNWQDQAGIFIDVPYTTVMGAPLRWNGEVIGGIIVLDTREPGVFDRNELWLLELLADLAVIAIRNAELHAESAAFSTELEQKVEARTHELLRAQEEISAKVQLLQVLLARTTRVQEEERERIAQDMHDGVVQLITAARYELQAVRIAIQSGLADRIQEKLDATREVLDETEQQIRSTIYNLMPSALNADGLLNALRKYVDNLQELSGIYAKLEVTGTPYELPATAEAAIYRLVEQALHNVILHANATSAAVDFAFEPDALWVTIQDNGQGFDYDSWQQSRDREHLGLLGMQERITNLGGTMEVITAPGQGTMVRLGLPCEQLQSA